MSNSVVLPEIQKDGQELPGQAPTDSGRCSLSVWPQRHDALPSDLCGTLEDVGCPLAPSVQDRLRFETLLAELSAMFVNVAVGEVDAHIESALRRIVEHLGLDRSALGEVSADGQSWVVTPREQWPWYTSQVHKGEVVRLCRLPEDLPPEAIREREYCLKVGLKSNLAIPLRVEGTVVGGIGFASFRGYRDWPNDLIQRLRLIGEIFTNAVARKRADEALRLSTRQATVLRNELAHATRLELVSHLTTSIAHEVNQPLYAIASNAQTAIDLLGMGDIEEAKKALEDIWADARRASEVIGRVRGMVKKDEPCRSPIPLATVFDELASLLHRETAAKGAALRINLDARDIMLVCDRVQLQQVLINLLLNAVEAISEAGLGPREVAIRVWREDACWARVSFHDTGVGLSNDDCERVFTPFFTTKAKGLGLGLSISRSLIEAHGGKLWATPGVEHGTLFHIRLPAACGGQP
jgi:signal transduction histidine kinase